MPALPVHWRGLGSCGTQWRAATPGRNGGLTAVDWATDMARGYRGEHGLDDDSGRYECPSDGGTLIPRDDVLPGEHVWWCQHCGWPWKPEQVRRSTTEGEPR